MLTMMMMGAELMEPAHRAKMMKNMLWILAVNLFENVENMNIVKKYVY